MVSPSGLNDIPLTDLGSVSVRIVSPVIVFHIRMFLSSPPTEASNNPSRLNDIFVATSLKLVCPISRLSSSPVCALYIQIPAPLATARRVPSGE